MENYKSKKILTRDMLIRTVKVSEKGQIAIPKEVREKSGIKKGDVLVVYQDKDKIMLEKDSRALEDDFEDLRKLSQLTMKKLWDNKEDEIWDTV
jgi:AbrB family looped-hinge helix DNA binding protein